MAVRDVSVFILYTSLDIYSFSIGRTTPFDCQVTGHSLEGV